MVVGTIEKKIIDFFKLELKENQEINFGDTNKQHILEKHKDDYLVYGHNIREIIACPDFIAKHPSKESLEYIKKYKKQDSNDYVLVAVRITKNKKLFLKTLFIMDEKKVESYKRVNAMISYEKL